MTVSEVETILDEQLDDLEARAADATADDLADVHEFGEVVHRVAFNINNNLYTARRVRDNMTANGELADDLGIDRTAAEVDDHIETLTALRTRFAAVVTEAAADVTIETTPNRIETTVTTRDGGWTATWEDSYGEADDGEQDVEDGGA